MPPPPRTYRPLWVGLALFGAAVIFGFGLALWVALLGGDAALAAGWRFAVTCFGGSG
ncbi:MAG: hypothetical protein ACFCVH_10995 [Alphaproteobacteria bacterium]